MRPYRACNDITLNAWNGLYHWAGAWHAVRDNEGRPIRFRSWSDAKHAAKLMHRRTRPVVIDEVAPMELEWFDRDTVTFRDCTSLP